MNNFRSHLFNLKNSRQSYLIMMVLIALIFLSKTCFAIDLDDGIPIDSDMPHSDRIKTDYNTVTLLLPNSDDAKKSSPVVQDRGYRVPDSERGWLIWDENKGEEELIVLAYPEPLPDPLNVVLSLIDYYDSKLFPLRRMMTGLQPGAPKVSASLLMTFFLFGEFNFVTLISAQSEAHSS